MPAGRVLRIDPGRSSIQVERRGRAHEAGLEEAGAPGLDVTVQSVRLVETWLAAMAAHDIDGALDLYQPTAVLHGAATGPAPTGSTGQETAGEGSAVEGRTRIERALRHMNWPRPPANGARVRYVDRFVLVEPAEGSAVPVTAFLVDGGGIIEHWIGVEASAVASASTPSAPGADQDGDGVRLDVVCRGAVSDAAVGYARQKVTNLVGHLGRPVRWGRIKLSHTTNPANERPSRAEVSLDVNGAVTRVHASADTMPEAVDEMVERLRAAFGRLSDRERHKPLGLAPAPGHWRHGNRASARPGFFDRPPEEREIVRHKTFAPDRLTLDDALWDLGVLDYDFFLFTEANSGIDCVVERHGGADGDQGDDRDTVVHGLADRPEVRAALTRPHVSFSDRPVPVLATSGAIELLESSGEPFELFENRWTGRRNVIYRRYDGHYGVITPPRDEPPSEERMVHEGG